MFPFIQCQRFDKRRGVYLVEKISVLLKWGCFFDQKSVLEGYFLILITNVCTPLNTQVTPPGIQTTISNSWALTGYGIIDRNKLKLETGITEDMILYHKIEMVILSWQSDQRLTSIIKKTSEYMFAWLSLQAPKCVLFFLRRNSTSLILVSELV